MITVLENSLYPGAAPTSISLALNYCRAAGLDPMQKPVHIVPMWDSKAGRMRDVIMPGVGLYRTQAVRTGQYAGVTEPEFGQDVTEKIGGVEITYPAWCRVTVKRQLANGQIVDFAATERWKENYAVKGGKEKSIAPNAMWAKRPYGQIAKCAEAQALRKAFPEMTGASPTADEMEGRTIESGDVIDNATGEIIKPEPKAPEPWDQAKFESMLSKNTPKILDGSKTAADLITWMSAKGVLTDAQKTAVLAIKPAPVVDVMTADEIAAAKQREIDESNSNWGEGRE